MRHNSPVGSEKFPTRTEIAANAPQNHQSLIIPVPYCLPKLSGSAWDRVSQSDACSSQARQGVLVSNAADLER